MNVEDQKSLIWNVIAFTLAVIAFLFIIFCAVLSLFFPKIYGDMLFGVGLKNASLSAYEYNYQNSKDINDLYLLLNKSIVAKNSEYIVKSYETLERRSEYDDFIKFVENRNIDNCSSTLEMLYLSNEDNYLKGKYVLALKKFKGADVALKYAYEDLAKREVKTSGDRVNFVLGYFISSLKDADEFNILTAEIKTDIYNYFNQLYDIYQTEIVNLKIKTDEGTFNETYLLDKFNLLKLNYRLTDIFYAMNTIDLAVGMGVDLTEAKERVEVLSKDFPNLL